MARKRQSIMMCLIRCGQTTWDVEGRVQGSADLPLSAPGRAAVGGELHRLAPARVGMVYHPSDEAATETARLCGAKLRAKTKAVAELADPHLGLLEGLTEREFSERFPSRFKQWEDDPLSLSPPEGEDMAAAADRIFRAVAKILKGLRSDEAAIVLHPLALGMLRCWLADRPMTQMRSMANDRPGIERYVVPMEMIEEMSGAFARSG